MDERSSMVLAAMEEDKARARTLAPEARCKLQNLVVAPLKNRVRVHDAPGAPHELRHPVVSVAHRDLTPGRAPFTPGPHGVQT